ncbi:hypothetical protein GCM10010430_37890 [Kitasatospora cystarginea]|uniref:Uncharacterized protein n=1 Tax=Kitasatospora cystarginea TaxID=58350 RepID=A0ABN3E8Y4_9ACTN
MQGHADAYLRRSCSLATIAGVTACQVKLTFRVHANVAHTRLPPSPLQPHRKEHDAESGIRSARALPRAAGATARQTVRLLEDHSLAEAGLNATGSLLVGLAAAAGGHALLSR